MLKDGVLLGNRCDRCFVYQNPEYWNFSWEVGTYYDKAGKSKKAPAGSGYKIRIILFDDGQEVSRDESDAAFTITEQAIIF